MFSNSEHGFDWVVGKFEDKFKIRATRSLEKFLGFSIKDEGDSVKSHYGPMICCILAKFRMVDCKSVRTPSQRAFIWEV